MYYYPGKEKWTSPSLLGSADIRPQPMTICWSQLGDDPSRQPLLRRPILCTLCLCGVAPWSWPKVVLPQLFYEHQWPAVLPIG